MNIILTVLSAACIFVIAALVLKIRSMQASLDEISARIEKISGESTNILVDVSSQDKHLKRLARILNTELKKMRHAYIKYTDGDRELKASITNISHDIRTPLTAICGYLDMLKDEEMSDNARRYTDIICNRANEMITLTNDFFKYTLALNSEVTNIECIDIKSVLEDTVISFYGMLTKNGIDLTLCLCEHEVRRDLDPVLLTRIFENIIYNAVKYSDGDLKISLDEEGNVTFENSAGKLQGIDVLKLFDRFFTVSNAQSSSGLGLSISKQLTERMNGEINACYKNNILAIKLHF